MSEASWMDDTPLTDLEMERLDYLDSFKISGSKSKKSHHIIECNNHGKVLYYQDIKKGGYWTQFKSNAKRFSNKESCESVINNMRFGSFKVLEVDSEENFR